MCSQICCLKLLICMPVFNAQIWLWQQRSHKVHEGVGRISGAVNRPRQCGVSFLSGELWTSGGTSGRTPSSYTGSDETTGTPWSCLSRMSRHSGGWKVLQVTLMPMSLLHTNYTVTSLLTSAIKHPVPDQVKPSFVIFDIRTL